MTNGQLLQLWETGLGQTPIEKSLHLLRVWGGAADLDSMANLSIGERDARLLQVRTVLFGSKLVNKANCPACSETVEWENATGDLSLQKPVLDAPIREFMLEQDGFLVRFRLPNSYDLHRATTGPDYQIHPDKLLIDCVLSLQKEDQELPVDALPAELRAVMNQRMETEDPQADIQMAINCPACGHRWSIRFDIVSYLWAEIDNWANHILQEVYALARAFGWSEGDILRMSSQRRQLYLDMIRR